MHPPSVLSEVLAVLAGQIGAFESLLLLASALHKAVKWRHLEAVLGRFAGIPPALAPFALAGSAALEVAAGGLLWVPGLRTAGAVLAVLIWTAYLALIVRAIRAGKRDADCGCSFGAAARPLGAYQVTRNAVLLGLAAVVAADALQSGPGGAGATAGLQAGAILAGAAWLTLYAALDQVMALQPLRSGEVA